MNNNRNNRRRGRGNRNQGSGNNANRIDSRARGNAPQLLDKYKKLAQDAQHNGDRVQAEYYLQFADHYFRVIADNKARQDEARGKRNDERDQAGDDDDSTGDDGDDRRRNPRSSRGQRPSRRDDGNEGDHGDEGDEIAAGEQEKDSDDTPRRRSARAESRKPRRKSREDESSRESSGIDAGVLPPAIGGDDGVEVEVKPRRRRRPASDDGGEGDDGLQVAG